MIKRILPILVLFLLLVILPLGSYLYLRKGIDYRMEALDMVKTKGRLIDFRYIDEGTEKTSLNLDQMTSLIHIERARSDREHLDMIYDQFHQSPNLNLLQITSDSIVDDQDGFRRVYSPDYELLSSAYAGKDVILVDTSLQVRSYYTLNDSTVNELVRDIAVILPLKKKSTIKMTDR